jgi:serine/threonine protein kinase
VTFGRLAVCFMNCAPSNTLSRPPIRRHWFWGLSEESKCFDTERFSPIPEFYSSELKEMIELCLERDYKRRPTAQMILSKPRTSPHTQTFNRRLSLSISTNLSVSSMRGMPIHNSHSKRKLRQNWRIMTIKRQWIDHKQKYNHKRQRKCWTTESSQRSNQYQ